MSMSEIIDPATPGSDKTAVVIFNSKAGEIGRIEDGGSLVIGKSLASNEPAIFHSIDLRDLRDGY